MRITCPNGCSGNEGFYCPVHVWEERICDSAGQFVGEYHQHMEGDAEARKNDRFTCVECGAWIEGADGEVYAPELE